MLHEVIEDDTVMELHFLHAFLLDCENYTILRRVFFCLSCHLFYLFLKWKKKVIKKKTFGKD